MKIDFDKLKEGVNLYLPKKLETLNKNEFTNLYKDNGEGLGVLVEWVINKVTFRYGIDELPKQNQIELKLYVMKYISDFGKKTFGDAWNPELYGYSVDVPKQEVKKKNKKMCRTNVREESYMSML